ncbi:hypothetical protein CAL12_06020 [Bordetella genomosp. 8]|uniref:DUF35 domain-containing protein n=1 Tax=Bordetella genomosp. 8 TaxID=1416806 RepID=A0A1W6YIP4_9BORD|nr:zinc ribbon domain-containing protein [Bordetella genomosp. 8]ARP80433.1 hypothetical protein CAL12_06020 [Bordetella genomosp. 8]
MADAHPAAALTVLPYLEKTADEVRLLATLCDECGYHTFPPSTVCPRCMSLAVRPLRLNAEGRLYSYTTMRHGAGITYAGYVDFPENIRVFGHLGGYTEDTPPVCDSPVRVVAAAPVEGARTSAPVDFKFVPKEVAR